MATTGSGDPAVPVRLAEPPGDLRVGIGRHGIVRAHDSYQLPEHWQLHL